MHWNPIKYRSVEEVFINHFEVLNENRSNLCVPHRLPEAARYFIWHHLAAPETAGHLDFVESIGSYDDLLAFEDGTVLALPDRIYDDPETWKLVMKNSGRLDHLRETERTITALAAETNPTALANGSAELCEWLQDADASEYINDVYCEFRTTLLKILTNSFRRGRCAHLQSPDEFRKFAECARELHGIAGDATLKADMALWLQNELGRFHSQRSKS